MENTPPVTITSSNHNTDSDRSHWGSLPTLSQLTRRTIDTNKNNNTPNSLSRKDKALMDSGRANAHDDGPDGKWEDRSGLLTPPSSQDATSMLISPPPEEILRMGFNSRHSGHHRQASASQTQTAFSPSLLSSTTRHTNSASASTSKRKRPGVVAPISTSKSAPTPSSPSMNTTTMPMHDDQPPEATPNPKPRKQSKRHARTQSLDSPTRTTFARGSVPEDPPTLTTPTKSRAKSRSKSPSKTQARVVIQSPHASNPNADFIPATELSTSHLSVSTSARRRSRSATPIPPYEPPNETFTPPREVTISPPHPPPSRNRRKSQAPNRVEVGNSETGRVKRELPDIDWTTPMPPPSPGDDPLLLSGRPRVRRIGADSSSPSKSSTGALEEDEEEEEDDTMQFGENGLDLDNPGLMDVSMGLEPPSTDFSDAAALPVFDLDPAPESNNYDDGWSDSDDDEELVGEGEYTGKFMMRTVKTKVDPPTSGTRNRMDQWGRPISPFPGALGRKRQGLPSVGEAGDEEMDELPILADDEGEEEDLREEQMDDNVSETQLNASFEEPDEQDDGCSEEAQEHSLVEAARDASYDQDESLDFNAEKVEGTDESLQHGDFYGNIDMTVELNDHGGLVADSSFEEEQSYHRSDDTAFEGPAGDSEDDEIAHMRAELSELHANSSLRGSSVNPFDVQEDESVEAGELFTFDREKSVEEQEEEEEATVDRELSCEPRREDFDEDGNEETEALEGESESSALNGTFASGQARRSSSGRWNKPLRPSDFAEQARLMARSPVEDDTRPLIEPMVEADNESSSGDETDIVEEGVVTITSNDPLAAARAAAILKLHDYDHIPRILLKTRRSSHPTPDASNRATRRKSAIESGVTKFSNSATKRRRRSTLGGMIGDRVFIPGSPAMTLPELLIRAEVGLEEHETAMHPTPFKPLNLNRDPFTTPGPRSTWLSDNEQNQDTRQWTKQDWKQLDACFTDERLHIAESFGMPEDALAEVDDVTIESVVERFIQTMGGAHEVEGWGSLWDRDSLETRVRALQKKQRCGNVAPPTPGGRSHASRLSVVPDFTPLTRRRPHPPALRPKLPTPEAGTPFGELASKQPKVPASLLAPRYSHLLEEAMSIGQDAPELVADATKQSPSMDDAGDFSATSDCASEEVFGDNDASAEPAGILEDISPRSPGISKRVTGFLFSYLPTMVKSQQLTKANNRKSSQPGLPLPPPEVLEKPRGPIATPIRPPAAKVVPPKAQVHLQHAPSPKKSAIPRPFKPQRLVKLNPTPMPESPPPMPVQRNRRSSGGSVKDLVRNFEVMDQDAVKRPEIKRIKSIGNFGSDLRPAWKP